MTSIPVLVATAMFTGAAALLLDTAALTLFARGANTTLVRVMRHGALGFAVLAVAVLLGAADLP